MLCLPIRCVSRSPHSSLFEVIIPMDFRGREKEKLASRNSLSSFLADVGWCARGQKSHNTTIIFLILKKEHYSCARYFFLLFLFARDIPIYRYITGCMYLMHTMRCTLYNNHNLVGNVGSCLVTCNLLLTDGSSCSHEQYAHDTYYIRDVCNISFRFMSDASSFLPSFISYFYSKSLSLGTWNHLIFRFY